MTAPRRPVTVVVPVYGDLPGLERCIAALLTSVDFDVDRVVLSNDNGPDADAIERRLLELVGAHPGFQYSRNAQNLGFVRNCNRAAFELDTTGNDLLFLNSDTQPTPGFIDEMAAVLASDQNIGAVCARSDNATLASLPFARRDPQSPPSPERTIQLQKLLAPLLPRLTPAPVAMGFCLLVRRELVARFGLFDEVFSPGYGEENDFCLRINEHGYTSVLANRALVLHTGSTSFSDSRAGSLRLEHERILLERYPYYVGATALFLARYRDAVDVFADAFLPGDALIRAAIHVPGALSDEILERVSALLAAAPVDVTTTVIVARSQLRNARKALPDATIAADGDPLRIFDVAVVVGAITSFGQLAAINSSAPRWVIADAMQEVTRWSYALLHHRATAIGRIVRRFEDRVAAGDAPEQLFAAVRSAAETAIDPDRLRERYQAVAFIAEATGHVSHSNTVSVRRLLALSLGARSPRLAARLRALRRG